MPKPAPAAVTPPAKDPSSISWAELRLTLIQLLPVLGALLLVSTLLAPAHATGDEGPILAAAHRVLHGRYAVPGTMDSTQFLWHGPGLPTLLAPLIALHVPLAGLRLTDPLLMFASAVMFYRLLRLRLSRRASLLGAYALGLYGPAYYVLGTVAKEPLSLLLSVTALDATARYLRYGRTRHAMIAGLALGALVMTRLEYGWVVTAALVIAFAWWSATRLRGEAARDRTRTAGRCLAICAVAFLACVPWLVYTYALTGHLFYWGNSGGLSLYWMSAPGPSPLGEWHAPHTVMSDPALAGYRPFFNHLASLTPLKRDLTLQHAAVTHALAHPGNYALNVLANLGRMFLGFPFPFTLSAAVVGGLFVINGSLLTLFAAAGRLLARARGSFPRETIPFLVFAALSFVVHVFPTSEPRMVLPFIPVAMWLIAQAYGRRRRGSARPVGERSAAALSGVGA